VGIFFTLSTLWVRVWSQRPKLCEGRATLQVLDTKLEQLFKLRQGADRKGMAEHPTPK